MSYIEIDDSDSYGDNDGDDDMNRDLSGSGSADDGSSNGSGSGLEEGDDAASGSDEPVQPVRQQQQQPHQQQIQSQKQPQQKAAAVAGSVVERHAVQLTPAESISLVEDSLRRVVLPSIATALELAQQGASASRKKNDSNAAALPSSFPQDDGEAADAVNRILGKLAFTAGAATSSDATPSSSNSSLAACVSDLRAAVGASKAEQDGAASASTSTSTAVFTAWQAALDRFARAHSDAQTRSGSSVADAFDAALLRSSSNSNNGGGAALWATMLSAAPAKPDTQQQPLLAPQFEIEQLKKQIASLRGENTALKARAVAAECALSASAPGSVAAASSLPRAFRDAKLVCDALPLLLLDGWLIANESATSGGNQQQIKCSRPQTKQDVTLQVPVSLWQQQLEQQQQQIGSATPSSPFNQPLVFPSSATATADGQLQQHLKFQVVSLHNFATSIAVGDQITGAQLRKLLFDTPQAPPLPTPTPTPSVTKQQQNPHQQQQQQPQQSSSILLSEAGKVRQREDDEEQEEQLQQQEQLVGEENAHTKSASTGGDDEDDEDGSAAAEEEDGALFGGGLTF